MESANVFYTNLHTTPQNNLLNKVEKLAYAAGFNQIDFKGKYVAIKMHFGEPGNLAFLRPNYAALIARMVKQKGGKPFLTDANTLYSGGRSNAVDHLQSATMNGFTEAVTGCPVIIADGLLGHDEAEIETNTPVCKSALIGKAVADADIIISLNHFKGHEMSGFGGALKNLGMGCASVKGKRILHATSQPKIVTENCTGCNSCVENCAHNALSLNDDNKAEINYQFCVGCGQCVAVCQYNAAQVYNESASVILNQKIAEYALAVLKGKPNLHINFMVDISPDCDCWNHNDSPLTANIGIAASLDPVALDMACAQKVCEAPVNIFSRIANKQNTGLHIQPQITDKFAMAHPTTDWKSGLNHAEKIGLGTTRYQLNEI
jgi:uncharacterized protein